MFGPLIKDLKVQVSNLLKWGAVTRFTKDSDPHPHTQITTYGRAEEAVVVMPYGYAAGLPADTLGIVVSICGDNDNKAFIPYAAFNRFDGQKEGELQVGNETTRSNIRFSEDGSVRIENKADLSSITVKPDGTIEIEAVAVLLKTAVVEVEGELALTVNGSVTVDSSGGEITIGGGTVNLGSGGEAIARVGDTVQVGANTGTITSGGTNTST